MSILKPTKKSYQSIEFALSAAKAFKGECEIKELSNGLFKVLYNRELNKSNPIKYKTISFYSLKSATSFLNKIKKEGLATNTNQDIAINTISSTLYKIRFIMNKQYQASNKYTEQWNQDGTFAYNNSSNTF